MLLPVISPAKRLDFKVTTPTTLNHSLPQWLEPNKLIVDVLAKLSADELTNLLSVSSSIGEENFRRIANLQQNNPNTPTKEAIFAFRGDTYVGFNVDSLPPKLLNDENLRFRILSGFYGVLRPLDLIHPHRLEMSTKLSVNNYPDLYHFWQKYILLSLNDAMTQFNASVLVNLSSQEYFKALNVTKFNYPILNVRFLDKNQKGQYQVIGILAKKARGKMTRFIVEEKISSKKELKQFNLSNYKFVSDMSDDNLFVFRR